MKKIPKLLAVSPLALMTQCAPQCAPAPAPAPAAPTAIVTRVIDGDTVELDNGDTVRLIGIDAPEIGQPCADMAKQLVENQALNKPVSLPGGARDDRDRYGRALRYVDIDIVNDVGMNLLRSGMAVPRYNSTDGYGSHPREAAYAAAAAPLCGGQAPAPQPPANVSYANCAAVRAAGAAPIHRGDPGYGSHLDRDNDGVGCE